MVHVDKIPGQITVRDVVLDVIEDLGIEQKWYKNMVRWAVRGFGELLLFHVDVYEETKLTPSAVGICTVPEDYVSWVAIGIPWFGRLFTVSRDNLLITTTTTVANVETQDSTQGEGVAQSGTAFYHYGETGGKNQYHLEWINNRQFMVNGLPVTNVILRYVSTGIKASGDSSLPVLCREALIAYIKKMYAERDPKSMSSLQYWDNRWNEELEKLRFAQFPTADDITDTIYETWTQTVKR